MQIFKIVAGIAMFLMFASSAPALEVPCPNCSQASSAIAAKNAGLGTHYVYDIPGGVARKYTVEREPNEMAGYDYFVFPDDVEQDFVDAVSALSAVWHETNGQMQKSVQVQADGDIAGLTAWDAFLPGPGQQQVLNWVGTGNVSWTNFLAVQAVSARALIAAAVNVLKSNPVVAKVTIVFADGSRIDVIADAWDLNHSVVPDSAYDAAGNRIPDSISDVGGLAFDYTNNGAAEGRMRNWIQVLGVSVSVGVRWACVVSAAGTSCSPY